MVHQNFQIYIHEPSAEYWIQKFRFPGKVQIIDFNTNEPDSMSMMIYAVGSLKYIVDKKLNRENCKLQILQTLIPNYVIFVVIPQQISAV